jgi:hypothetical protein
MKTVFNNDEIPHLWAHGKSDSARNSGGSISIRGRSIFSYQTVMGERLEDGRFILNRGQYSVTTSGHQSKIASSLPFDGWNLALKLNHFSPRQGTGSFYYGTPKQWLTKCAEDIANKSAEFTLKGGLSKRWAGRSAFESKLLGMAKEMEAIAAFFNIRASVPKDLDGLIKAGKSQAAKEAKARKEAEAKAIADFAGKLAEWRDFGGWINHPTKHGLAFLRINSAGDVETSKGITLAPEQAQRVLRFVRSKRESGWHRNGETFQIETTSTPWQLDAVNDQGIVAGCHVIEWSEIETLADAAGWN